jgi:hypothetical protein
MQKPMTDEYNPYFQHYIDISGDGVFLDLLQQNTEQTVTCFSNINIEKHNYKYATDKWTIKEVLMHIIDTERVFAYRAFVCMRGDDKTLLHSMDEHLYAANANVADRTMQSLIDEFLIVRKNSSILFEQLSEIQSSFKGNAITHPITARALGYIMIGHIKHHINIINERYL